MLPCGHPFHGNPMYRRWLIAAIAWAGASAAQAADIALDGYGTLGVVYSDEPRADYVRNLFQEDGAGRTRTWSPEVDSRLGLQLSADFDERLDGVVQVVAEQGHDDHYTPAVEWANLQYEATDALSLRAGRVVARNFLTSEYRKVGYAIPWVRPPQEVYRLVPITNVDGLDLTHRSHVGGATNTVRVTYGGTRVDVPDYGVLQADHALLVSDQITQGGLTLYAAYSRAELTLDGYSQELFDAYREAGPEGEAIAERYDMDGKRHETVMLGGRYDPGDWFLMGEWAHAKSQTFFADSRGWYSTAGYRIGQLTPYLTLAKIEATSATSHPGIGEPQLDGPLNEQLLGISPQQERISLGTRWDFDPGAALKLQFDYLDLEAGSRGVLVNEAADYERGGVVRVFSATVDFVF